MPWAEEELLPISALQHLLFCERQCALIHVERLWVENRLTAEGRVLHRRAHSASSETRDGVRITRGLPLCSYELGIVGQADVVTWQPPATADPADGTLLERLQAATSGELRQWHVTPVEYKRGRPKSNDCDRVQLCAQALCLEEMLEIDVPAGDLYYGQKRRRVTVNFDRNLRQITTDAAIRLHDLLDSGRTPRAHREAKCDRCSMLSVCLPDALAPGHSAREFLERTITSQLRNAPASRSSIAKPR